jgi:hypothetical protein
LAAMPWNTIFAPGPMLAKVYSTLTSDETWELVFLTILFRNSARHIIKNLECLGLIVGFCLAGEENHGNVVGLRCGFQYSADFITVHLRHVPNGGGCCALLAIPSSPCLAFANNSSSG